jgi:hypothetical protein
MCCDVEAPELLQLAEHLALEGRAANVSPGQLEQLSHVDVEQRRR